MVKRNFKIMAALAITLSLGSVFSTAHAATASSTTKKVDHKMSNNKSGFCHPVHSILETKLGFTQAQIDTAAKAGKTAFDLAKEKGMTADQLRAAVVDVKSKKIDQMVTEGKITKDKADTIKANLPTKIQKWDGSLRQHKEDHHNPAYSVLEKKLGFTKAQIDTAAKAGKTAFDLASEKGMTADQLKTAIIDSKLQKINEMVTKGKLTKDKADTMKANLTIKIQKWDGSLTHKTNATKTK